MTKAFCSDEEMDTIGAQSKCSKRQHICRNEIMSATVGERNKGDGLTCRLKCSFILELQQCSSVSL